jgi:hypothetical protein
MLSTMERAVAYMQEHGQGSHPATLFAFACSHLTRILGIPLLAQNSIISRPCPGELHRAHSATGGHARRSCQVRLSWALRLGPKDTPHALGS